MTAPRREASPYNVFALTTICLGFFLSYADRQILSVVLTPVKHEFALSDTALGLIAGLGFGVFYSLLSLPLARMADRGNRKRILAACIAIWSAATMACGAVGGALQLVLARMVVAVGEAGGTPTSISLISDLFARSRGIAIACYNGAGSLGAAAVAVVGAWIASEYGWRWAFVAVGAPGIVLALVVAFGLRNPVRGENEGHALANEPGLSFWGTVKVILKQRALVYAMLGGGTSAAVISATTWLPSFLQRSHGLSLAQAGGILGVGLLLSGPFGEIIGGLINDRLGARDRAAVARALAVVSLIAIPIGIALVLVPNIVAALALLIAWKVVATVFVPPTWGLSQELVRPDQRATSQALTGICSNLLGYGLGPAATGWFSELLAPSLGSESLRWALVASLVLFGALSVLAYMQCARALSPRPLPATA